MVKKSNFKKLPSGDYAFSDGITITAERIRYSMSYSKLSDVDRRIMEDTTGKSYELLTAETLHEKAAAERAEEERKHEAFLARLEAQTKAEIENGKKLFLEGKAFCIHDKKLFEGLPPFDDDTFQKLFFSRPSHVTSETLIGAVKTIPKNYPDYTVFICEK